MAAFSLLIRHWKAIEHYNDPAAASDAMTTPLLQQVPLLVLVDKYGCVVMSELLLVCTDVVRSVLNFQGSKQLAYITCLLHIQAVGALVQVTCTLTRLRSRLRCSVCMLATITLKVSQVLLSAGNYKASAYLTVHASRW